MHFTKKNEHTIPLFINAKILPLNFLYYKTLSELMHDASTASAPSNIRNLFTKTSSVHSYNTRSSTSENFYIKASRLEIQKNAFSGMGAKLWNEIPSSLRELPEKSFTIRIKNKLLSFLGDKDSFIEIHKIILNKMLVNKQTNKKYYLLNNILFQLFLLFYSLFYLTFYFFCLP